MPAIRNADRRPRFGRGRSLGLLLMAACLAAEARTSPATGVAAPSGTPPAGAGTTEAERDAAPAAELVRAGRYRLRYFGRTLASEDFRIERTTAGYRITAEYRPQQGDQVASRAEYVLDERRGFVRATWEPLAGGVSATYRVETGPEGRTLVAEASDGSIQRVPLAEGELIAGPHYFTDFFVPHPLEFSPDQEGSFVCHTFGFEDWRVHRCTFDAERVDDRRLRDEHDEVVTTTVYRCLIDAGSDVYRTRSYLDPSGVAIMLKVAAPVGSAVLELRPPTERTDD